MKPHIITVICLLFLNIQDSVLGQNIEGIITDSLNVPIPDVTVILQSKDSVFIDAVFSSEEGKFVLTKQEKNVGRLIFQHITYHPHEQWIDSTVSDIGQIILYENQNMLDMIHITAERPILKVEGNTLSYNVSRILDQKALSNAFDVLKEIPGISGTNDEIKLIGASSLTVILNGQVSTIPSEQFYTVLKSIPATQIKNIDVMYNAPAKYNVRGALVNIITDNSEHEEKKVLGEITAQYLQSHYAGEKITGNISYRNKNIHFDFMANTGRNKSWDEATVFSKHNINSNTAIIDQKTLNINNIRDLSVRFSGDIAFNNQDNLSFSYFFDGDNTKSTNTADSKYTELTGYEINSTGKITGNNSLNNAHIEYAGHYGLTLGIDYTNYKDKLSNNYTDFKEQVINNDFINNSRQDIDRWNFSGNYTGAFSDNWTWEIGFNSAHNKSLTDIDYLFNSNGTYAEDVNLRLNDRQNEYAETFYIESNHTISEQLSLTVSLQSEYFNSKYNQNGNEYTLWNEWAFLPHTTFTYLSGRNMFQLAFSSNKKYPSFWAINPQTTKVNSYMEIAGNPLLKPSKKYEGQFIYLLDKKYTFLAFAAYKPQYFSQIPFQDQEDLKIIYQYTNFDYDLTIGLGSEIPVRISDFGTVELMLYGLKMHQKLDNFHNYSFDREKYVIAASANCSFVISQSKPDIKFQITGDYQSKAIQGVYDIGNMYDVSSGLKWTFANGAYLLLKYDNILKHSVPNPTTIHWENQYNVRNYKDQSTLSLTFSWRFGDYKAKRIKEPDRSRLQR